MSHDQTDHEHSDNLTTDELSGATERALRQFSPRAAQLDRDRLMFLAGQASIGDNGKPTLRARPVFWPAATVAMTSLCAALLVALVVRSQPIERIVIQERIVYLPQTAPAKLPPVTSIATRSEHPGTKASDEVASATAGQVPHDHYLKARDLALAGGIEALHLPDFQGGSSSAPSSYRDLLEQMVPRKAAVSSAPASLPGWSWPRWIVEEMNM